MGGRGYPSPFREGVRAKKQQSCFRERGWGNGRQEAVSTGMAGGDLPAWREHPPSGHPNPRQAFSFYSLPRVGDAILPRGGNEFPLRGKIAWSPPPFDACRSKVKQTHLFAKCACPVAFYVWCQMPAAASSSAFSATIVLSSST